ncbi:MAG: ATP-binding protein [Chloroflexi bacterium]|nr:ATP-binding protein [Chloroflexota bacterium]
MAHSTDWHEEFTGSYATPEHIGRQEIQQQIKAAFEGETGGPCVVFVTARGGIGKTRLLNHVLKDSFFNGDRWRRAASLIDFYHVQHHATVGLVEAIFDVLAPHATGSFRNYTKAWEDLDKARVTGEGSSAEKREAMLNAFAADLKALSQLQRVVLAFDTAERLVYNIVDVTASQTAECWEWLKRSLPDWGDVVLVIAGRPPQTGVLRQQMAATGACKVVSLELRPFESDEARQYFEAVVKAARAGGDNKVADRVAALGDDTDMYEVARIYAGGHPVTLALLVDYLSVIGKLPEMLRTSLAEARRLVKLDPDGMQKTLQRELVTRLAEAKGYGDALRKLGRATKGADAALLGKMLGMAEDEVVDTLERMRNLSFVKTRRADHRIFLHDEFYALLQREIYSDPSDAEAAETDYGVIRAHYDELLAGCIQSLQDLYRGVIDRNERLRRQDLIDLLTQRQTLQVELVHYVLRVNADEGFKLYYRYLRESILSGEDSFQSQLQAEMLDFLAAKDPTGQASVVAGIDRSMVLFLAQLNVLLKAYAVRDYQNVLQQAEHLRMTHAAKGTSDPLVNEAAIEIWEAYALTDLSVEGNLQKAGSKFDSALEKIKRVGSAIGVESKGSLSPAEWRRQAVLGLIYHGRGYLRWLRGDMRAAIAEYQQAAICHRAVDWPFDAAATSNDMGFARAEQGEMSAGYDLVNDGYQLRLKLGFGAPVGYSLSTLAAVRLRQGEYAQAGQLADKAVRLFRALDNKRGIGMALFELAQATRRHAMADEMLSPNEKVRLLREARDYARESYGHFRDLGEAHRKMDSRISEGVVLRDWVRVRTEHPGRDDVERLFNESRAALEEALSDRDTALFRKLDAAVNLAFLGLYRGDDQVLGEGRQRANSLIPDEYRIAHHSGQPAIGRDVAQAMMWPQLGRLHTLNGRHALKHFSETRDPSVPVASQTNQYLQEAAREFTLCFEYNALYGEGHPGFRDVQRDLFREFKTLSIRQLRMVKEAVEQTERDYNLGRSYLRHFLDQRALWVEEM